MDGNTLHKLPALIECDQIQNAREEIPVPEVARHHSHLQNIEAYIAPMDRKAEILLLIGRDLPQAHHVLDQRTGPGNSPYAQKLSLGWVIVGEACLGGAHQPNIIVNKTSVMPNGRPSLLSSCPNEFHTTDIFARTKEDEDIGLSVEDRDFLELMNHDFNRDKDGCWVAPLPFRSG